METIDLNKVAGFQALDNEGNVLGIVSMEQLTDTVAMRIAESLSGGDRMLLPAAEPMAVTAAATGSDKMETALGETTDPAYVRVIDKSGNSAKQGISSLASVVGELIGRVGKNQLGLIDKSKDFYFIGATSQNIDFNDIIQPGMNNLHGNNSSPNGPSVNYGIMCVFASGGQIIQLCANVFTEQYRIRTRRDNGTWTLWKTIALSD